MLDNFDLESFLLGIIFVLILAIIIMMILCLREYIRLIYTTKRLKQSVKEALLKKTLRNELEGK